MPRFAATLSQPEGHAWPKGASPRTITTPSEWRGPSFALFSEPSTNTIFHLIFQDDEECGQRGEQGPPLLLLDSPSSSTDVKQSGVHVPWIFEAYGAFAWDHTHGQLARTSKQDQAWYASSSASLRGTRNSHREVVSGP
ncbi:hypothetical protein HYQ45_009832 [Verticillium longisporum]|uniref:Uncharacterized protein n=1 Tax=Verticillium longisporum TaxID=100787 RepID=A0A8I2ZJB2_VERLO|nr:hypothetical protein HYQ45_009832 [Verticillium longisporum]